MPTACAQGEVSNFDATSWSLLLQSQETFKTYSGVKIERHAKMSVLQASPTFIWSTTNILGKGATGAVYQGINKTTGEAVAVKTFNKLSHMRPYEVQIREFDVLKKIKNENIVKLLAIEQEMTSHSKILVMELCTGGSLFTILDDPENTFGLCEEEFLLVLKHLTNGMKYLRDNSIVHRDLKPGNILKYIAEDGQFVYKLTDFGAARELDDDQQFVSLYGTEEYLHPDMYERAVLRKPVGKAFGATVDLWSIGVTLYHVATGALPFRPYGGRRNRETMYSITTEKESGVISGSQSCENGPIEWSRELPATCQLCIGLRKFVTPLLAGLMECDAGRQWSFEQFFAEVCALLQRQRLRVFHVSTCQHLTLYVEAEDKLEVVRCLVFEQTDVAPDRQLLLCGQKRLEEVVGANTTANHYPATTPREPLFLLSVSAGADVNIAPAEAAPIPKFPTFPAFVSVEQDSIVCKTYVSIAHCIRRSIEQIALNHFLFKSLAAALNNIAVGGFNKLKSDLDQAESRLSAATQKTKMLQSRHRTTCNLLDLVNDLEAPALEERNKLQLLVNSKHESNSTVTKQLPTISNRLMATFQRIVIDQQLWNQWKESSVYQQDISKCPARASVYAQTMKTCWQHLARNRNARALSNNDEQFHMLEKVKMQDIRQKLSRLYQEECQATQALAVQHFGQWLGTAQKTIVHANCLDSELEKFVELLCVHDSTLDEANETYDQMAQAMISSIRKGRGSRPDSAKPLLRDPPEKSDSVIVKNKNATRLILDGIREVSISHSEIMRGMAENQLLLTNMRSASLTMNSSLRDLSSNDHPQ